jgi:hypothetical protein
METLPITERLDAVNNDPSNVRLGDPAGLLEPSL